VRRRSRTRVADRFEDRNGGILGGRSGRTGPGSPPWLRGNEDRGAGLPPPPLWQEHRMVAVGASDAARPYRHDYAPSAPPSSRRDTVRASRCPVRLRVLFGGPRVERPLPPTGYAWDRRAVSLLAAACEAMFFVVPAAESEIAATPRPRRRPRGAGEFAGGLHRGGVSGRWVAGLRISPHDPEFHPGCSASIPLGCRNPPAHTGFRRIWIHHFPPGPASARLTLTRDGIERVDDRGETPCSFA
jgi:hypothetical protein